MAVTLNKANLVLKDANGNIGKIEQLSSNDLAKIKTAVSDVALVVNQSNHTPIEATTTNKGVVQLATPADVVSGASDKVVTAEQLHNSTTGTSALATENLARIDAVVTEAGIPIDHTNTNQLKTAVTTLISNATPATATANTLGVVKPDNDTITIDSNGVLTATGQMPGVATISTVGVVKPDNDTITIDSNGVLTATKATQDSAGQQINTTYIKGVTASNATITVTKGNDTTSTATINNVANATNASNYVRSVNGLIADAYGNVNIKVFELQRDVQKSLTGTLSATLTNTDGTTTKTVSKSYSEHYYAEYENSSGENGHLYDYTDTFAYGVTFSSTPRVTTSDSDYYKVSSITTTNAQIAVYTDYSSSIQGGRYYIHETRPSGTATATGQAISSKVVSKTVSKIVNYGVTYKDVPTISNVVGCTVSDIGTTACTVTTTLSTTLSSGQSTTLDSNFSFDAIGDVIISYED